MSLIASNARNRNRINALRRIGCQTPLIDWRRLETWAPRLRCISQFAVKQRNCACSNRIRRIRWVRDLRCTIHGEEGLKTMFRRAAMPHGFPLTSRAALTGTTPVFRIAPTAQAFARRKIAFFVCRAKGGICVKTFLEVSDAKTNRCGSTGSSSRSR